MRYAFVSEGFRMIIAAMFFLGDWERVCGWKRRKYEDGDGEEGLNGGDNGYLCYGS